MILDTDVLSVLSSRQCPGFISSRLRATYEPVYASAISWAEICYGMARLPAGEGKALRTRYEESVLPHVRIVAFTAQCAEVYGRVRAELARQGTPLADADLMIAATALCHDLPLITGNTRHFSRVPGLRVENWFVEDTAAG